MAKFTYRTITLAAGLVMGIMSSNAQQLREGYVDFGKNTGSENFHTLMKSWAPGKKVSADDNFFISRVKPHQRFRNVATQIRKDLDEKNDKKLLAWVPVNNPTFNALPDGLFDSEVFTMWSYVTHWGDWTSPVGRIPAAFIDVAHKNGVGVSGVASIPYGALSSNWRNMIKGLAATDPDKVAKFFRYYGIDGMGYNSEFSDYTGVVEDLRDFHADLVKAMKPNDPMFENFWYDGTNDNGNISFDQGLGNHNQETFGDGDNVRTSLFFNYNWNRGQLARSVTFAEGINRNPLDLYAGVNMQGGEPGGTSWSLLPSQRISIGLWGAHSYNMFWESRDELGSSDDLKQEAYLLRTERYFTGGTRNPANCPSIKDKHAYTAKNYDWHGMSSFMTARSALSWDLAEEPFMTYFNLGNGKYFNLNGERKNNHPWYNVGMQDYLPTWHFWFASKLLGNTANDVPATGLDANFTWDDAYFGGSSLRISGTSADEYLHLFKTKYTLKAGDVITVRYKLNDGASDIDLLLSAEGSETSAVSYNLCKSDKVADVNEWVTRTFTVGSDFDGKDLALVALHFKNAKDLNLLLGEFSVVRGSFQAPEKPELTSAEILYNGKSGMDGKVIFNMPNSKTSDEPCYNIDVKTSYFRLYAQQEGQEPVFIGATTSWAGLYYSIPVVGDVNSKMRLGVSAVSLDQKSESEIAWRDYLTPAQYTFNDDIQINKKSIKPGESFSISYVDGNHPAAQWELLDASGKTVKSGNGKTFDVDGLNATGNYTLKVVGAQNQYGSDGKLTGIETTTRTFNSYVQVTSEATGATPEIYTLTANEGTESVKLNVGENVKMAYTGRAADGQGSQGLDLKETRFGVLADDLGLVGAKSFSISFWLKVNSLKSGNPTALFNVYNKKDDWPKTDWGWIWTGLNAEGKLDHYNFRGSDGSGNNELHYKYANTQLPIGNWVHLTMSFDYNDKGQLRSDFFVNGELQKVTHWDRNTGGSSDTTQPGYEDNIYNITKGMYLCIGGPLFSRYGIDGAIDNVVIWNKVANADDAKAAMGDLNASNLPSGVAAFWDFEKKAGDDHSFASVGSLAGIKAGMQDLKAEGSEGQATMTYTAPDYTLGCPFLNSEVYKVQTESTWTSNNGKFTNVTGNCEAGSADVSYRIDGSYDVTLTLSNPHGQASRTFSVITVGNGTGINGTEASELKAYTVGEDAVIEFAEAGNYEVSVFNTAGQVEARKGATLNAGNVMNVHLAKAGIYLVNVKKDGKTVRTVKLIRK